MSLEDKINKKGNKIKNLSPSQALLGFNNNEETDIEKKEENEPGVEKNESLDIYFEIPKQLSVGETKNFAVYGKKENEESIDLTSVANIKIDNEKIVTVIENEIKAHNAGKTKISAFYGTQNIYAEITVDNMSEHDELAEPDMKQQLLFYSSEKVEDTHKRSTFNVRRDLLKRLHKLSKGKHGFKTQFINYAIESTLDEIEKDMENQ